MDAEAVWWREGLRFSCANCGRCCGTYPGTVCFTDEERDGMAAHIGVEPEEFDRLYVWRKYGVRSLRERSNYDCVLIDAETKKCTVYDVRPTQCRTFPFWEDVIENKDAWETYASFCPGMNRGDLHSADEILTILNEDRDR